MTKIPVGKAVAAAYEFAFGNFLKNLGIVWLPVLIVLAASWFFIPAYLNGMTNAMAGLKPRDPQTAMLMFGGMMRAYRLMLLFYLIDVLVRAQMLLGLTREALDLRDGPSLVFFSIGRPFWRVVGAYFAVIVILIGVYIVALILAVIVSVIIAIAGGAFAHAAASPSLPVVAAIIVCILAVLCVLLYVAVRLTFLLTVSIVAEDRFTITRSWELTKGNFWRIFVIGIAIFLPVGIALYLAYVVFTFGSFLPFPMAHPHDIQAQSDVIRAMNAHLLRMIHDSWYIYVPLAFIGSAIVYGLGTGASVFAYRTLMPPRGEAFAPEIV